MLHEEEPRVGEAGIAYQIVHLSQPLLRTLPQGYGQ
jgi:hypothetical protein